MQGSGMGLCTTSEAARRSAHFAGDLSESDLAVSCVMAKQRLPGSHRSTELSIPRHAQACLGKGDGWGRTARVLHSTSALEGVRVSWPLPRPVRKIWSRPLETLSDTSD